MVSKETRAEGAASKLSFPRDIANKDITGNGYVISM